MYKNFYDEFLFKYKLIHSKRLRDVYSDIPHVIDSLLWKEFEENAGILNSLVLRILEEINGEFEDYKEYIPHFNYKDELLGLKSYIRPTLWTRYDGFIKDNGEGVFFSEFNYDKPCAQRECVIMGKIKSLNNNVNKVYEEALIKSLVNTVNFYLNSDLNKRKVCFLVGATCYEEYHLALFLKSLLKAYGIESIISAPENINLVNCKVYAFDVEICGIIRLFPGESLYEIKDFLRIIERFEREEFFIVNDPRVVFIQNKALYAYLWKLVINNDNRLSTLETDIIKKSLPYTEVLNLKHRDKIIKDKDKYVLKPALGRYSRDVYIGKLFSEEEWKEKVNYVYEIFTNKMFVVQEFINIKTENSIYYDGVFRNNIEGYGNYGIFILQNKVCGCCLRWTKGYLTSEEETWITPIIKNRCYIKQIRPCGLTKELEKEIIFKGGFYRPYNKEKLYIDGSLYEINSGIYKEIVSATEEFSKILEKTYRFAMDNFNGISSILSIEEYSEVILKDKAPLSYFVSRLDWAIDRDRNIRLLEINSETPAGICEAAILEEIICDKENYIGVSSKLKSNIKEVASNIINYYKQYINCKTKIRVAFLTLNYYEDFITTKTIMNIVKNIEGIEYTIGNIHDLEEKEDGVYLYGEKIHLIYRHYPLQWIYEDSNLKWLTKHINKDVFFMNSAKSIVSQSKGFFAVIYELMNHKFYSEDEKTFIKKYIPYTTYDMEKIESNDFIIKPLLEREGHGVRFSSNIFDIPEDDVIFQERVFMEPIHDKFLIFGAYMIEGKFSGIYCREGKEITTNDCRWIPLCIKKG